MHGETSFVKYRASCCSVLIRSLSRCALGVNPLDERRVRLTGVMVFCWQLCRKACTWWVLTQINLPTLWNIEFKPTTIFWWAWNPFDNVWISLSKKSTHVCNDSLMHIFHFILCTLLRLLLLIPKMSTILVDYGGGRIEVNKEGDDDAFCMAKIPTCTWVEWKNAPYTRALRVRYI